MAAEGSSAAKPPAKELRDALIERARAMRPELYARQAEGDRLGRIPDDMQQPRPILHNMPDDRVRPRLPVSGGRFNAAYCLRGRGRGRKRTSLGSLSSRPPSLRRLAIARPSSDIW